MRFTLNQNILKRTKITPTILLFSLIIFILSGCKKDSDTVTPTPPLEFENLDFPGIMMTLSAISYIDGDSIPSVIRDSIDTLLKDPSLATGGHWKRVWGPGISGIKSNMIYVAMMKTPQFPVYAVVIRGTNMASLPDVIQDVNVFSLVPFTYGQAGDMVAKGGMEGLDSLLTAKDGGTGKTLEEYLNSLSHSQKMPLFVTGHSQGGGLAPLMAYWLITNDSLKNKFLFNTFAFAGPSVTNASFNGHFRNALSAVNGSFHMLVNSLDVIPYLWADLKGISAKNIPVYVPSDYRLALEIADSVLSLLHIKYDSVTTSQYIGFIPITETGAGGITPADSIKWYDHWLATEHNHNNYLRLLGVKPLTVN